MNYNDNSGKVDYAKLSVKWYYHHSTAGNAHQLFFFIIYADIPDDSGASDMHWSSDRFDDAISLTAYMIGIDLQSHCLLGLGINKLIAAC